jgi:type VI secretion system protein ImpF
MNERDQNAQASVLDRLIDSEPGVSHEPVQFRLQGVREVKASVIRDLENLLNTRRPPEDLPRDFRHVQNSLLAYGLRDFTASNPRSAATRQQLRVEIERMISQFEPRLRNVVVQLDVDAGNERVLRFRISGILIVEPLSEPVTFDTVLDVNRAQFKVAG